MGSMSFYKKVLDLTCHIPRGKVTTYGELARALGSPLAGRAVGNALHANTRPVVVPCHRVVRADGSIGGYGGGVPRKVELLREEGVGVIDGRIDLQRFGFQFPV